METYYLPYYLEGVDTFVLLSMEVQMQSHERYRLNPQCVCASHISLISGHGQFHVKWRRKAQKRKTPKLNESVYDVVSL